MKKHFALMVILVVGTMYSPLIAKTFDLYGYSDFLFTYKKEKGKTESSFMQNRTNILLASEFFKKWDFFVNVEFTGAYSTHSTIDPEVNQSETHTKGSLELEEAWTRFSLSEKFRIRAGLFHAPFGSFNVIQDASLTYITVRPPMIYDDSFRSLYPVSIIPDKANLEISGRFREDKLRFEYHLYVGNGLGTTDWGTDINSSKSLGVRLRLNHDEIFKIGISYYRDNAVLYGNGNNFNGISFTEKRRLLSVDLNVTLSKFNLNGEYIFNTNANNQLGKYNRTFWYMNLNYQVLKKLTAYAEYDNYKDRSPSPDIKDRLGKGINKAVFGINFKPNWKTAIKLEIQDYYYSLHFKRAYTILVTSLSVIF